MTRDEWCGLPPALALGLLWDKSAGIRDAMERVEAPAAPRAPKYDQAIYRSNGITWASEYDLEGLQYWHGKYAESASSDSKYAEKDAKKAKQLSFWIAWRRCCPGVPWSGERNREQVTASPPNGRPFVYDRDKPSAPVGGQAGSAPSFEDDDDIPF